MAYPHVPFPVAVPLTSTLFHAAPFTSNASTGWASNCNECANSVWSTSAPQSSLNFNFWGWDVAFDGQVQGSMNVKFILDGLETTLNPANGTLFAIKDLDNLKEHSLSLTVQSAEPGSSLSVNQARINASTFSDDTFPFAQWELPSNDGAINWSGFTQQPSAAGSFSPATYVSSGVGNTGSMTYNGSTVIIYGPCSPTSGLLKVSIDNQDTQTVNTSSPITSSNCILYQSRGYSALALHTLSFSSESDAPVSINHLSFFRVLEHSDSGDGVAPGAIVGGVIGGIVLIAILIVAYSMRSRKTRQKINRAFTMLCS
ncbi:hypothetical protein FRC12_019991 [Ceratobasidium sp. 428]|nr:hypothetical protein FRC12_019991 [Ceratobasidium sp. 428]